MSKVYDFENQKLINRSYANEIFANFSKIVSGTYAIYSKEDRISRLKITIRFNCSQEGCNKKLQMSCLRSAIAEGHDLSFAVASNEEKCEHNGTTPRCRNISAQAREAMKEKLKTTTPRCLYKELVEADDLEGALKGSTSVPTRNALQIMRKELLKEEDLDLDPVIDVMKQAAREEFKLIDLSVSPFRCSLVSQRQVNVVLDFAKKHPNELRRAHFDATGSILSKLSPENP